MHVCSLNEKGKIRKLFHRRLLIFGAIACMSIYVSGKLYHVIAETDSLRISFNLRGYSKNLISKAHFWKVPTRLVHDVNCDAIIKGNKTEIERAKLLMNASNFTRIGISDSEYIELTKNCDSFKNKRYAPYDLSVEENGFSVAYSILLYKEVEQAERLLRAIYSPQNYYCLHVDADAKQEVHDAINSIANCFDNVFVVSRKEYIVYAGFTRLQADLTCMENLLQRGKPDDKPWLPVFVAWDEVNPCEGKYVRGVCVLGVGDLHSLTTKPHFFANKFYLDYQPFALDCMEEWHFNRTARGMSNLNVTYYKSLPFIKRGDVR